MGLHAQIISRTQISNDDKPIEGVMLGASNRIDAAPADDRLAFAGSKCFATVLADPPQFNNRTGKMAQEHRRLSRYSATAVEDIAALPVAKILTPTARLYLWGSERLASVWARGVGCMGLLL